jgi:hypothetical protein
MVSRGAGKLGVSSRSWMVIIPLFVLLLGSALWNIRHYKLVEHYRLKVVAEERAKAARANSEVQQAQARLAKKAEHDAADLRVQQLYREIDNLSRINEQLLEQPPRQLRTQIKVEDLVKANGAQ